MRVLVKGQEGRWRASCVGGARSGDSRRRTDVVGVSWDPYPVPSVAAVAASSVARHAIDATPARWRSDVGPSPLDGAGTAASSPRNDLVKNCRVHPTHWLISTQVPTAELGFAPLQTSALQTSVFQQSRVPSQRRQTVVQDQLPVQTAGLEVSGAHAASPVAVAMPQAV